MKTKEGKKRVLIIDDDRDFTDLLNAALEMHGEYDACAINDPRIAVATARKFAPDIVILDVVMPEVEGGEVHAQFTADPSLKHIPIIFLTSIVEQGEVEDRKGIIGGCFYVAKPVSASNLISVIKERIRS